MTRQDYVLIAETIKSLGFSTTIRRTAAEAFATNLATTNPRFDRERFIAACLREGD